MKKYPEVNSIKITIPATMITSSGHLVKKVLTKGGAPRKVGGKRTIQLEVSKDAKEVSVHQGRKINRKGEENKKRGPKSKSHVVHHHRNRNPAISSSNIVEGKRHRKVRHVE